MAAPCEWLLCAGRPVHFPAYTAETDTTRHGASGGGKVGQSAYLPLWPAASRPGGHPPALIVCCCPNGAAIGGGGGCRVASVHPRPVLSPPLPYRHPADVGYLTPGLDIPLSALCRMPPSGPRLAEKWPPRHRTPAGAAPGVHSIALPRPRGQLASSEALLIGRP